MKNIFSWLKSAYQYKHTKKPIELYSEAGQRVKIPFLGHVPDSELQRLNALLPWSTFVNDSKGRIFGAPYSSSKRNTAQTIPDYRIRKLNDRYSLQGKTILEAGCFEGLHTVALAQFGGLVSAFDGRVENLVKTLVRCNMFNINANIFYWNLEEEPPQILEPQYEILHHIGVLYHLSDPIRHLETILKRVKTIAMLDTHVADGHYLLDAEHNGFSYRYLNFQESGRKPPFAGLTDTAKWIHPSDIINFLKLQGFSNVQETERRQERNGLRSCFVAER